jgi:hypothetical protein
VKDERGAQEVVIEDRCLWERPGAPSPFEDVRRWTIRAPSPDLRLIEADISLTALIDVRIEKTNHSLFSVRVASDLSPADGGTLEDSESRRGEKATFGQKADWCGFHGTRNKTTEGIAILVHPKNPWSPCPWFTRDYGFISPTPMNWLGAEGLTLKKGEKVRLRYLVVVHGGTAAEAKIGELWREWSRGQAERAEGAPD